MKRHIYALGKLAGLTVQQCRTLSNNLWLTSPHQPGVTPRQGEGDSVTFPVRSVAAPNPNEEPDSPSPQRTPMVGLGAAQHSPTTPAPSEQDM
eukprot:2926876-Karenia_brevis.AAC.1